MSDAERLVVLLEARLDQFEKAMKQAEGRGVATYQKLQDGAYKATSAIEKRMQDTAKAMGRSLDSIFGAGKEWTSRAAMNADFRAFLQSKDAVDQLRASMDPLFAASKRYEAAVADLDRALKAGAITEAEHAAMLERVGQAYLSSAPKVEGLGGGLGRLGTVSDSTKAKIQNVGFQVQDLAVQIAGGTSATRALSQQLPQLLSGFGLVGIAVGTLASVGLPLLGAAFGSAGGAARSFEQAMGDVKNSVTALQDAATTFAADGLLELQEKYGDLSAELVRFIELQDQAAKRQALLDVRESITALIQETEDWSGILNYGLDEIFPGIAGQVNHLVWAMQDLQKASTFEGQLEAATRLRLKIEELTGGIGNMTDEQFKFYRKVLDTEDALRQLSTAAPKAGWLAAAIGQAETLAGKLWEGVRAKLAVADGEATDAAGNRTPFAPGSRARTRPERAPIGQGGLDWGTAPDTGSRGGGGGGTSAIDGLIRDLQTERELVDAWYAESLGAINSATEAQLAAIGGRHGAIERLETEHQARLRGIRDESNTGALAQAEGFFGGLATLFAAGGNRLVKAQRVTAAAEALINTYRAQAQVLADPKLSFWQKFPAMAAVGAAGLKLVGALGGGGSKVSGAGGSSGTKGGETSTAQAQTDPLKVILQTLRGVDAKAIFQGQALIDMADALLKEFGARNLELVRAQ